MKIEWTDQALRDLKGIYDYISADSVSYADNYVGQLFAEAERLAQFPLSGRTLRNSDKHLREIIFRNHRLVYRVLDDRLRVLLVVDARRSDLTIA